MKKNEGTNENGIIWFGFDCDSLPKNQRIFHGYWIHAGNQRSIKMFTDSICSGSTSEPDCVATRSRQKPLAVRAVTITNAAVICRSPAQIEMENSLRIPEQYSSNPEATYQDLQ